MWRLGESISVVKTNSGAAVTTCTSCPALIRCLTTCAKIERKFVIKIPGQGRSGRARAHREETEADLEGAGGVAEAVAGDVVGEDEALLRRRRRLLRAASPGHHPPRRGRARSILLSAAPGGDCGGATVRWRVLTVGRLGRLIGPSYSKSWGYLILLPRDGE